MDPEKFAKAIAPYTRLKKESPIEEYDVILNNRRLFIDIRETDVPVKPRKKSARNIFNPGQKVITPKGSFDSVAAAAEYHGKSKNWIYTMVRASTEGFYYYAT